MPETSSQFAGDRLAKVIARAGLCSRRDAEQWIKEGRVAVNGAVIRTPAFNVTAKDQVKVDGAPLVSRSGTRVWAYHKPAGLVVTEKDPEGRPTVFDTLAEQGLPRVLSIGRLDINTEGLLLLTNDGGLKRVLELPATGWLRRYRVRAFGTISQPQLDALADGLEVDGVKYGPIEATLEREQGSNVWLVIGLREGKNREVKNVLEALGLQVNRLIRVSFGPFQLSDLPIGGVEIVKAKVLREQLGKRLADEAGVDFDSEMPEPVAVTRARRTADPTLRAAAPGKREPWQRRSPGTSSQSGERPHRSPRTAERPLAPDRPGSRYPRKPPPPREDRQPEGPRRRVFNADGSSGEFTPKTYGKKPARDARGTDSPAPRGRASEGGSGPRSRDRDQGGRTPYASDRPKRPYAPRSAEGADRPKRAYAPRSAEGADRPKRAYAPRSADAADRPKRPYAPRGTAGADGRPDRPKREFSDRPKRAYAPRASDAPDRPKRAYAPRPAADLGARPDRPKRPYAPRAAADSGARPDRPKRDFGDRPKRDFGDRPRRDSASPRPPSRGPRPAGDKPVAGRPRGSGPAGDRPRRPRPPKA
jgi:23S rRNA pseudouridine2605 synthase